MTREQAVNSIVTHTLNKKKSDRLFEVILEIYQTFDFETAKKIIAEANERIKELRFIRAYQKGVVK